MRQHWTSSRWANLVLGVICCATAAHALVTRDWFAAAVTGVGGLAFIADGLNPRGSG